jgi:hypothetical protein
MLKLFQGWVYIAIIGVAISSAIPIKDKTIPFKT